MEKQPETINEDYYIILSSEIENKSISLIS